MNTHDWLMTFRPLSHGMRLWILPEIDRRLSSGALDAGDLPVQIRQFRFLQVPGKNVIELNDEVQLVGGVKAKGSIQGGQILTVDDIDPETCVLEPPIIDGHRAAFFLCQSLFLNIVNIFDFTPNAPAISNGSEHSITKDFRFRYPIGEVAAAKGLADAIRPVEKFRELAAANWPPAPGYYPGALVWVHNHPGRLADAGFADVVAKAYGPDRWAEQMAIWTEINLFPRRMPYVQKAVDEYLEGDFISSIHVLVPHVEGILKDFLRMQQIEPKYQISSCVSQLKELIVTRRAMLFPRPVLDLILEFIETGTFLRETTQVGDPAKEVNRHGIAHGVFAGFETRNICLKYLILLDALAFVLLHDRLVTGTL